MQAARGAPLNVQPAISPGPWPHTRVRLVLLLAAVVIALDQTTKAIALSTLATRAPIELLGGLLTLRLVRNPGAAFGMASGFTIVLSTLALVVTVVIVRAARSLTSLPWAVALGLLLGGAIGNLTDRFLRQPGVLRGHVIDFLELPNWPVFNLADSSIVCAGVLMVFLTFRGVPATDHPDPPAPAPVDDHPAPRIGNHAQSPAPVSPADPDAGQLPR